MKKEKGTTYKQLYKEKSPKSKVLRDVAWAFFVRGAICALGQGISSLYLKTAQLPKDTAAMLTSATLIALSALATGAGVYDKLSTHAGAGSLVPITGFANAVVSPALEFKSDDRVIIGTSQKHHEIKVDVLV